MSQTLGGPIKVKISYKGDTRKVNCVKDYNELHDIICQLFTLESQDFVIRYASGKKNSCITCQKDFLEAFEDFESSPKACIKFSVTEQNKKNSHFTPHKQGEQKNLETPMGCENIQSKVTQLTEGKNNSHMDTYNFSSDKNSSDHFQQEEIKVPLEGLARINKPECLKDDKSQGSQEKSEIDLHQKHAGIHEEYYCNGCDQFPLQGPRFKCIVCEDLDLCLKCSRSCHQHHPMIKFDSHNNYLDYLKKLKALYTDQCENDGELIKPRSTISPLGIFKKISNMFSLTNTEVKKSD
ncbi:unnamed protein product [Moneuplotes crassus]|uniref:ZZ-type domain-containing protein n=1 Tax=Euplotes crassus TaxID=5936 RepID=A0AAD1UL60_EUPCR|nr:unnamed protein product [Moneuplotes crassus]